MPRKHILKTKLAFWSLTYENVWCELLSNKVCVVLCLQLWIPETAAFLSSASSIEEGELALPNRWTNSDILFILLSGNTHSKGKGSPNFLHLLPGSFLKICPRKLRGWPWRMVESAWISHIGCFELFPVIRLSTGSWPCLAAHSQLPKIYSNTKGIFLDDVLP